MTMPEIMAFFSKPGRRRQSGFDIGINHKITEKEHVTNRKAILPISFLSLYLGPCWLNMALCLPVHLPI
jgi:hypothetical protein